MQRVLLFLALFAAVATPYTYTCNQVKNYLIKEKIQIDVDHVCVLAPASVQWPYEVEPYQSYIWDTDLYDVSELKRNSLIDVVDSTSHCIRGYGPWMVEDFDRIACTSDEIKYAELIMIFISSRATPNVYRARTLPVKYRFGAGTHILVAPEGSLLIEKESISDETKDGTIHYYTGGGLGLEEEMYPMLTEKFVAGSPTVIIGPVTTIEIVDDIEIELTISSFEEDREISVKPGSEIALMSSGMATNMQSSRPKISVSASFGDEEARLYDALSITGTVKIDENVPTSLTFDCSSPNGLIKEVVTETRDVLLNLKCATLDITYSGSLDAEKISQSGEVIYLRITSNSELNPEPEVTTETPLDTTTEQTEETSETTVVPTEMSTKRTLRPTSTEPSTKVLSSRATTVFTTTEDYLSTTTKTASSLKISSFFVFVLSIIFQY